MTIEVDEVPIIYKDYLESYFSTFKINKNNFLLMSRIILHMKWVNQHIVMIIH